MVVKISCILLLLFGGWGVYSGNIENLYKAAIDHWWQVTAKAGFRLNSVYLSGHNKVTRDMVLSKLPLAIGQPIMRLSLPEMQRTLEEIALIQRVEISRSLPDSLHIRITERKPIALWQRQGKLVPVDEEGVVLQDKIDYEQRNLPLIVGSNANRQLQNLLAVIEAAPDLLPQLDAAIWVGDRRWNVQLKNGMVVKLPQKNAAEAWHKLYMLIAEHALLQKNIKVIDMRLPDRMFIEKMEQPKFAAADRT